MFYKKILFLLGPTAVGKTKISLQLNKKLSIKIINVDSSMIYKNMNIGTAKPHIKLLNKISHYLINILNIKEKFSALNFCLESIKIIKKYINKNIMLIFVGGNLMYVKILQDILLKKYKINCINITLIPTKNTYLKKKIKNRLIYMLKKNFIKEILYFKNKKYFNYNFIGYKQFYQYFENKSTFSNSIKNINKATKYLALTQLLWLKFWNNNIIYIDNKILNIITKINNLINKLLFKKEVF